MVVGLDSSIPLVDDSEGVVVADPPSIIIANLVPVDDGYMSMIA